MWGGGAATAMLAAALVAFLSIATLVSRGGEGGLPGLNSQSDGGGSLNIQFPEPLSPEPLSPDTSESTASGSDAPATGPTLGLAATAAAPDSVVVAPGPAASAPSGPATSSGGNGNDNTRGNDNPRSSDGFIGGEQDIHRFRSKTPEPAEDSGRRMGQEMDRDTNGVPNLPGDPPASDTPDGGQTPDPVAPPADPDLPPDPPGADPTHPTDPTDPTAPPAPAPTEPPTDPTPPPSDPSEPAPPVDPPPPDPTEDPAYSTEDDQTTEPSEPSTPAAQASPDQPPPDELPDQSDSAGAPVGRAS
jgi:hypothetical protein